MFHSVARTAIYAGEMNGSAPRVLRHCREIKEQNVKRRENLASWLFLVALVAYKVPPLVYKTK